MFSNDLDYFKLMRDGITGERNIDEKTFEAAAVLSERLENLKKTGDEFDEVSFSPQAQQLLCQCSQPAVS